MLSGGSVRAYSIVVVLCCSACSGVKRPRFRTRRSSMEARHEYARKLRWRNNDCFGRSVFVFEVCLSGDGVGCCAVDRFSRACMRRSSSADSEYVAVMLFSNVAGAKWKDTTTAVETSGFKLVGQFAVRAAHMEVWHDRVENKNVHIVCSLYVANI